MNIIIFVVRLFNILKNICTVSFKLSFIIAYLKNIDNTLILSTANISTHGSVVILEKMYMSGMSICCANTIISQ